jgi:hypothetical protein
MPRNLTRMRPPVVKRQTDPSERISCCVSTLFPGTVSVRARGLT